MYSPRIFARGVSVFFLPTLASALIEVTIEFPSRPSISLSFAKKSVTLRSLDQKLARQLDLNQNEGSVSFFSAPTFQYSIVDSEDSKTSSPASLVPLSTIFSSGMTRLFAFRLDEQARQWLWSLGRRKRKCRNTSSLIQLTDGERSWKEMIPSLQLSDNRWVMLEAVTLLPEALLMGDKRYLSDKQLAIASVREWGYTFAWITDHLKQDDEVMYAAVQRDPFSVRFAKHTSSQAIIGFI